VNFPPLQLERVTGCRLSVTNENVPKILGSVLSILADENINVIDMLNKSRELVAYNLIDIDTHPEDEVLDKMRALEGVINVRLIGDCA
jgi:D-3-phosphoglycerate dehydrogenase